MITKSKFIKGLWFVEDKWDIDNYELKYNDILEQWCIHTKWFKKINMLLTTDFKNPKGLFLTKLATEEDWKELRKLIDIQTEKSDKFICESLLYKQEGLDNEKNYLIIREE